MRLGTLIFLMVTFLLGTMAGACAGSEPSPAQEPSTSEAPVTIEQPVTPEAPELELFLEVLSPKDESIIITAEIEVVGNTLSTAIVSVNGILIPVKADGVFSAKVILEEGPNLIEVVSSDVSGNEVGEVLAVIYMPE